MNTELNTSSTCTHHNDSERTGCPVCLVAKLRAELAVAQNWVQHKSHHADDLIAENVELRAERDHLHVMLCSPQVAVVFNEMQARADKAEAALTTERARMKKIETALKDAISTYFGADKLVTAERIEAWQFAMKEDGK
jgi:regulator of replication initiation timing